MVQLAGKESYVTWLTFALLLLPGAVAGALLGWAGHQRLAATSSPRWLWLSPAALASAIFDPTIFEKLIHNGEGGGSLIVVATALAGGHASSRRRWSAARVATTVVTGLGLLMVFGIGGLAGPVTTARGAWTSLLGFSCVTLLVLAASLAHDAGPAVRSWSLVGGLAGLAWAGGLRGLVAAVDGLRSPVHWTGTFAWVLLPGLVAGVLLALAMRDAEHCVRRDRVAWAGEAVTAALVVGLLVWSVRARAAFPDLATPHGLWIAVLFLGLLASAPLAVVCSARPRGVRRADPLRHVAVTDPRRDSR